MKEFALIEQWAEDRNLVEGSTGAAQMLKLYEEFGELAGGLARSDMSVVKDSVGDVIVVLTIVAAQAGFSIRKGPVMHIAGDERAIMCQMGEYIGFLANAARTQSTTEAAHVPFIMGALQALCEQIDVDVDECIRLAYDDIKDRKGQMVDGVFIKEEDLK